MVKALSRSLVSLSAGKGFTVVLLVLTLCCCTAGVFAQQTGTIVGKITDDITGEPLAGVNVYLQDTRIGAATDIEGQFTITRVPPGDYTFIATFIGFKNVERQVVVRGGQELRIDISMEVSALAMDEVIVTGLGYELKKKELTTPVSSVSSKMIEEAPVTTVDNLIQGRVPGSRVRAASGQHGTGSQIMTRGITSVAGQTTPVIYIDGVRVDNRTAYDLAVYAGGQNSSALSDLLVEDIERIEVTKAGAASTLFGSEAANGVIQIFTKKGKAGKTRITYRTEQGFDSAEEKYARNKFTKEEVLNSGYYQQHSINLEGGSELGTFYFGGSYKDSEGVMDKLGYSTYSTQMGLRGFMSDKLTVDASFGFVRDDSERQNFDNTSRSVLFGTDMSYWSGSNFEDEIYDSGNQALLAAAKEMYQDALDGQNMHETVNRTTFSTTFDYQPYKIWTNKLTVGVDYRKSEFRAFYPKGLNTVIFRGNYGKGMLQRSDRENLILTMNFASTLNWSPYEEVSSALTFGAQGFRQEERSSNATGSDYGLPGTQDFDNAGVISANEYNVQLFNGGYYLNEQIGWNDKVFLNFGVRFDYNSAFGDDIGVITYPKAGIAYTLSDENFFKESFAGNYFDEVKLRGSWGQTGKFPDPYAKDRTFVAGPFLGGVSVQFDNPGDSDLGPEKTSTIDLGFDAAMFDNRFTVEFSYFSEETKDAIFSVPMQPNTGLGTQQRNVGTIENKGIEVSLNLTPINNQTVRWSIGTSFASLNNEVTDMGGYEPFRMWGWTYLPAMVMLGKPVGTFETHVPKADGAFDIVYNKSLIPDKSGSVNTSVTLWNKLTFSARGDWQTGGWCTDGTLLFLAFAGKEVIWESPHNYQTTSDTQMMKTDFFKLREITARYNLGRVDRLPYIDNIVLHASVRNVWIWDKGGFADPETQYTYGSVDIGGISSVTPSPPHEFRFGIQLGF